MKFLLLVQLFTALTVLSEVSTALVKVQPCIISPNTAFHLNGDYATYAFPQLAARYWPDLNVSRMRVIGDYYDVTIHDVVRSYMDGNGATLCNLVIGPAYSDGCIAISPLIGKPLWVDFASTSSQLSSKTQFPNFLRTVQTDAQSGGMVASLLKTLGWKHIFIIRTDNSYGESYTAGVVTSHTRNGGSIVRTFNLLVDTLTLDVYKTTLSTIRDQQEESRIIVVVGVNVATFVRAAKELDMDGKFTFFFPENVCSSGTWNQLRGSFCVGVDLNQERWANYTRQYQARSDAEFNVSADELMRVRYPRRGIVNSRNTVSSAFSALAVDAVFYGLTVLQQYLVTHNNTLPTDSSVAGKWAIKSNISIDFAMSGTVGMNSNGDRQTFITAIYNSGFNSTSQISARDLLGNGNITFSKPITILSTTYDFNGRSNEQIAAVAPADRVVIPEKESNNLPSYVWVLIAIAAAVFVALSIIGIHIIVRFMRRGEATKFAPKSEAEPVAIIFTDIESSTSLWAECPQQMVIALELHNSIIRKCLSEHRGYEVKTIGDSFMIAFSSAVDAVQFSLAMQSALHAADWSDRGDGAATGQINNFYDEQHANDLIESPATVWNGLRVRIGGHAGFVSIKRVVVNSADGKPGDIDVGTPYDYFGSTVNVAARIEAIGHGGQVLVSKALLDACDSETYKGALSYDRKTMGNVELRGYNEPVQVFQLSAEEFNQRAFLTLRIQKAEIDFDNSAVDETTNSKTSVLTGTKSLKSHSNMSVDMVGVIQTFSTKRKLREEDVKLGFIAIDALTSVMPHNDQKKLLTSLIKAWHIKDDVDGNASKDTTLKLKLLMASRLGPVINVRELKLFGVPTVIKKIKSSRTHSRHDDSDHMSILEGVTSY